MHPPQFTPGHTFLLKSEKPDHFLLGHSHGTDWVEYNTNGWLNYARQNPASVNAVSLLQDSQKLVPAQDMTFWHVRFMFSAALLRLFQENHQLPLHEPTRRSRGPGQFHRWPGGRFSAVPATSYQHEEDLHHGRGGHQEEVTVHPDKASSGERTGGGVVGGAPSVQIAPGADVLVCTFSCFLFNLLSGFQGNAAGLYNRHITATCRESVMQCNLRLSAASKLFNLALKKLDAWKGQ